MRNSRKNTNKEKGQLILQILDSIRDHKSTMLDKDGQRTWIPFDEWKALDDWYKNHPLNNLGQWLKKKQ